MKKLLILIIIVIVAVVAWTTLSKDEVAAPTTNDQSAMNAELDGLTDADLDAEFKVVDEDAAKL